MAHISERAMAAEIPHRPRARPQATPSNPGTTVTPETSVAYFNAPSKKLVWFGESGHESFVDEPDKFNVAMACGCLEGAAGPYGIPPLARPVLDRRMEQARAVASGAARAARSRRLLQRAQ